MTAAQRGEPAQPGRTDQAPLRQTPVCSWCGTDDVNWHVSWNVTGEWTCDRCAPWDDRETTGPGEDW